MTVAVNALIDKSEIILSDITNARFAAADLLGWLNTGAKAMSARKPDVNVKNESFVLVAGAKQGITGAISILDITRNMGVSPGTTPGDIITKVKKKDMDTADPSWHKATASATVIHWMYDNRDPARFWVYPPQPATGFGYVDGVWCEPPGAMSAGGNITVADIYEPVLIDYIVFRALNADAAIHPNAASRAVAHAQLFLDALSSQDSVEEFVASETQTASAGA